MRKSGREEPEPERPGVQTAHGNTRASRKGGEGVGLAQQRRWFDRRTSGGGVAGSATGNVANDVASGRSNRNEAATPPRSTPTLTTGGCDNGRESPESRGTSGTRVQHPQGAAGASPSPGEQQSPPSSRQRGVKPSAVLVADGSPAPRVRRASEAHNTATTARRAVQRREGVRRSPTIATFPWVQGIGIRCRHLLLSPVRRARQLQGWNLRSPRPIRHPPEGWRR